MIRFHKIAACALVALCACIPSLKLSAQESVKQQDGTVLNERYLYAIVDVSWRKFEQVMITVDYGQEPSRSRNEVLESRTRVRYFPSIVSVLNWLSANGWNLQQIIGDYNGSPEGGSSTTFKYLVRKNVTGMTESDVNRQFDLFSSKDYRRPLDGIHSVQDKRGNFPE